jgi:CDP-diacylglycerol--serine O-phosphatidyltransferase
MKRGTPIRYIHISNTLTYASLLAGLLAVITAKEFYSWHVSGALIAASVVLDTFDGRFARLFPRSDDQRAFGTQLDSLVDAVVFGAAPVICMYFLLDFGAIMIIRALWVGAALAYLICALTRLGCYNLHQTNETHFTGMPTTLAALLLSTLFLVHASPVLSGIALSVCALVMVAPLAIPRPRGVALAVFVIWITLVLSLHVGAARKELKLGINTQHDPAYGAASWRSLPVPSGSAEAYSGVQR